VALQQLTSLGFATELGPGNALTARMSDRLPGCRYAILNKVKGLMCLPAGPRCRMHWLFVEAYHIPACAYHGNAAINMHYLALAGPCFINNSSSSNHHNIITDQWSYALFCSWEESHHWEESQGVQKMTRGPGSVVVESPAQTHCLLTWCCTQAPLGTPPDVSAQLLRICEEVIAQHPDVGWLSSLGKFVAGVLYS